MVDRPSNILIVDDTVLGRETLAALLANQGYTLAFANDGLGALAQAADLLPDLILLDVMMPGVDGYEVCRRLRVSADLAEVPIILVTTLDDRESLLRGIEAGADDFISKPFDRFELRARVRTITRLNRYRSLMAERLQRQQAQQESEHRQRELQALQEADRLKNEFVSNVAHELRTPLMILTLTSDNLGALYDTLDDQQRKKLIHQMINQTKMLNDLMENVLDIARLDSQQQALNHQPVDLAQLLRAAAEHQSPLSKQKTQVLQVIGCASLMVTGDAGLLDQVLSNLLSNALKYTPIGGHITCECSIVRISPNASAAEPTSAQIPVGAWAAVRVVDNGIGIAPEQLPHLFERFYRVKNQSNIPGTGLGLAITKELVQLHHGHIVVESMPDKGSSFAIYLPLLEKASDVIPPVYSPH